MEISTEMAKSDGLCVNAVEMTATLNTVSGHHWQNSLNLSIHTVILPD